MTIRDVAQILDAKWVCGEEDADQEILYAFASDMMSDVLAHWTVSRKTDNEIKGLLL